MKKILTFILVSVLFVFIPVFAMGNSDSSKLSRVFINKLDRNTFTLNMYFDSEYRNKAFIQQIDNGRYIIYLPEATQNVHTPIVYADNYDRNRIKLDITKNPFVEKNKTSNYTKIAVNMNSDYSLKIISKLTNEDRMMLLYNYAKNSQNIMLLLVLAFSFIMIRKVIRIAKSVDKRNGSIHIPIKPYIPNNEVQDVPIGDDKLKEYLAKRSTSNPLRTANRTAFKSFDLNNAEQNQQPISAQKRKIESNNSRPIQKQQIKDTKLQQNPIKKEIEVQPQKRVAPQQKMTQKVAMQKRIAPKKISELKVNSINLRPLEQQQEIKPQVQPVIVEQKKPDVLSRINISASKGLYLAAEGDIISLYGFNAGNSVLLKRFRDLSQLNLQARFFDHSEDGDVYIVRIDSYKSMIAFKDDSVCELVVL